jgi:CheY-like chemotaxis protein
VRDGSPTSARILIVDDDPANVQLLERALQAFGYRNLRGLTTPASVVETCREFAPDLILLDFHMPPLTGPGLLAQLRADLPASAGVPVLMVTGDVTPEAEARALAAGAAGVIRKPIALQALREGVAHALAGPR